MKFSFGITLLTASFKEMGGSKASAIVRADGLRAAVPAPGRPRKVAPLSSGAIGPALDVGLLSPGKEDTDRRLSAQCSSGEWVDCEDGKSNGQDCVEACGGLCCRGEKSCEGFTGKLCKDDLTCVGYQACLNAKIGVVAGGCHGIRACQLAKIDVVAGGCYGGWACTSAGYGGSLGKIYNACHSEQACVFSAQGGTINEIVDSCNKKQACKQTGYSGNIPTISTSCNEERSCSKAGMNGNIGGIQNSCNNSTSCYKAGHGDFGTISSVMTGCCNEVSQCESNSQATLPSACDVTSSLVLTPPEIIQSPPASPSPCTGDDRNWRFVPRRQRGREKIKKRSCANWVNKNPRMCGKTGINGIKAHDACCVSCQMR